VRWRLLEECRILCDTIGRQRRSDMGSQTCTDVATDFTLYLTNEIGMNVSGKVVSPLAVLV